MTTTRKSLLSAVPLAASVALAAIAFSSSTGCVAYKVYSGAKWAKKGVDYVEDKFDDDDKDKKTKSSSTSSSSSSNTNSK